MSLLSLLAAVQLQAAVPFDCGVELERARSAYGVYDAPTARSRYLGVREAECPPALWRQAGEELARIAWLVDGDDATAIALLEENLERGGEPCASAVLLGRVLNAGGRAAEAPDRLRALRPACDEIEPGLALEMVEAFLVSARQARPMERSAALDEAISTLEGAPDLARASLRGARQRLEIGVLGRDADQALAGWRAFYWIDDDSPQGFDTVAGDIRGAFHQGLATENGPARLRLAELLVRGGFDLEAAALAADAGVDRRGDWRRVDAYLDMRRRLDEVLLRHDRARAADVNADSGDLEQTLLSILRQATAEAGRPGDDPWPALRELWGLVGTTGLSNGVSGLHLGHVSEDRAEAVEQAGRRGQVRFIALDNMLANSFSGWLGDGMFAPGGWAADGRIIQVRDRYVQSALNVALLASPGSARDQFIHRMREREQADPALAASGDIVFLPGLSDRLRLQAIDALAAEVRERDANESTFAGRFARLWYERSFEGTILLHEGRHALDQAEDPDGDRFDSAELEYRAKLSELAYSTSPRVMLTSIYGRLIGGETGHGVANFRLLSQLASWIEAHPDQVVDHDPDLPALVQLDRLTDAQLRELARDWDRQAIAAN